MQFQKITRDDPPSFATFEAAVNHLRKLHECSHTNAMSMAANHYPDLVRKYNDEGEIAAREAAVKRAPSEADQRWDMLVTGIMERDTVSRTVAMERARHEYPEAFVAYQAA